MHYFIFHNTINVIPRARIFPARASPRRKQRNSRKIFITRLRALARFLEARAHARECNNFGGPRISLLFNLSPMQATRRFNDVSSLTRAFGFIGIIMQRLTLDTQSPIDY